jgi:putative transcriptional regulator
MRGNMAVRFKIKELATKAGYNTAYKLQQAAGLYPSHASNLFNNKTSNISLEIIERLCVALECEPGDLFERKPARKTGK